MKLKTKIWIEKDGELVMGKGRAAILRAVHGTGSLNQAALSLGLSYRKVWSLIKTSEKRLGRPLLIKSIGGKGGGGTALTPEALEYVNKFDAFVKRMEKHIHQQYEKVFGDKGNTSHAIDS